MNGRSRSKERQSQISPEERRNNQLRNNLHTRENGRAKNYFLDPLHSYSNYGGDSKDGTNMTASSVQDSKNSKQESKDGVSVNRNPTGETSIDAAKFQKEIEKIVATGGIAEFSATGSWVVNDAVEVDAFAPTEAQRSLMLSE